MKKAKGWVFVIAFLLFLTLPTVLYQMLKGHIDTENHENRVYAAFPELSWEKWPEFPAQFEAYYNDRVPFKNQFKRLHTKMDSVINKDKTVLEAIHNMPAVTEGKEEWLFYTPTQEGENSMAEYFGINLYTEDELALLAQKYQALNDYFKARGITFVVFVPPNKEQVYPEYMPEKLPITQQQNRMEQVTAYIQEHTDVTLLYPREDLLNEKDCGQLYWKNDSHWNDLGSFVGTQMLIETIKGQATSLDDVKYTETIGRRSDVGDLVDLLGLEEDRKADVIYQISGYKEDIAVSQEEKEVAHIRELHAYQVFHSNAEDQRKVMIFGDSFVEHGMVNWLPKEFGEVIYVYNDSFMEEPMIEEEKPDIVILEVLERRSMIFENQTIITQP